MKRVAFLALLTAFWMASPTPSQSKPKPKPKPSPKEPSPELQSLMDKGLALYDQKSYFETAKIFHEIASDEGKNNEPLRQKAEFFLGKSLYNLDYFVASSAYFQRIAQAGPNHSYYRANLQYLAALAQRFANQNPILELIGLYTIDSFPESDKEELSFFLGKFSYNQNNLDASLSLLQSVTSSSPYFLEAKFLESIIYVRQGASAETENTYGKQALDALKEMLRYIEDAKTKPEYKKKERRAEIDRYEQLVSLTMGRVFYSNRQYRTAIKYFDKVSPESDFWLEALFGETWTYFQIEGFDRALGHIHTLNSPYFESEFYPESLIVKSVIYFYNCRYDESLVVAEKFAASYGPVIEELKGYSERFTENEEFYKFVARYRKGKATVDPRVERLAKVALSDKALIKQFEQVELIDQEQKRLKLDTKKWAEHKIHQQLEQDLEIAKTFAISEAGLQVRNRFQRIQRELQGLYRDSLKIQFEAINAQAEQIDKEIALGFQETLDQPKSKTKLILDEEEHWLWKFDREYWKDELGYYRSPITSKCKTASEEPMPEYGEPSPAAAN